MTDLTLQPCTWQYRHSLSSFGADTCESYRSICMLTHAHTEYPCLLRADCSPHACDMWRQTPLKEGAGYGRLKRQQEQEVLAPAADEEEEEEEEDESEYETDSEDEGVGRAMLKPVFVPKVSAGSYPKRCFWHSTCADLTYLAFHPVCPSSELLAVLRAHQSSSHIPRSGRPALLLRTNNARWALSGATRQNPAFFLKLLIHPIEQACMWKYFPFR